MPTLAAKIQVLVDAMLTETVDIGNVEHKITFNPGNTLSDGTGADQAKQMFSDTRTLSASATENLDLFGGLTNAFGTTLNFTKIKAIIVKAAAGNTNDVVIGGHATAAFINWVSDATDKVKVKPGGMFMITAPDANGLAVTASTGDMLTVANSAAGTSVTYDVVIIGVV